MACVDRLLHGGELITRLARRSLEDGSISIERPGLIDYHRRIAEQGGEMRFRAFLTRPINECRIALVAAAHGRCDDTGWIDPPPSPLQDLEPAYEELLGGLWRDLGRGLGERRARRVVCGVVRIGERLVAEEVTVILAARGDGQLVMTDLLCRNIEKYLVERLEVPESARPRWPPSDPQDAGALMALEGGVECLTAGGHRCLENRAPLPGVSVRDLMRRLEEGTDEERQRRIDSIRTTILNPHQRSHRMMRLAPRQCVRLMRISDPKICSAVEHRPGAPEVSLPAGLSPSLTSQTMALSALIWGKYTEQEKFTSKIRCPAPVRQPDGSEHISLDVVWTRDELGAPVLLDLVCF